MRLTKVRVQNFKCIEDSGEFTIEQVTSLVGKNEAGKSALLDALFRLNPVSGSGGYDTLLHYPRRRLNEYEEKVVAGAEPDTVVTTTWELNRSDLDALNDALGAPAFIGSEVIIMRGYDKNHLYEFEINEERIVAQFLDAAGLHQEERAPLAGITTVSALIDAVAKPAETSARYTALLTRLQAAFPKKSADQVAIKVLSERMPKFLYFSDYYKMRGTVSVTDVVARKAADGLRPADRVFLALLAMAGTTMEQLASMDQFEPLIAKLEAVSIRISNEIFRYWSQNKNLKVIFRADLGKSGDPAPYNEGVVFRARVENQRHQVTVGFDERSTGFVWFFSFLVWFSQIKKEYGDQLVILLDEPALTLHARAQADLLRYIGEKLAPQYQVMYTTHSPFMIDPAHLLGARTVEDVVDKEGNILGTKVGDDVLSTDADTVFPLQAALGYDITQTLFIGQDNILVEGPSDYLYLTWASEELKAQGRAGLDRRWRIAPTGGIDKVAAFVTLFGGNKLNVAVVTDLHQGDKAKVNDLKKRLLQDGRVFSADSYAAQPEADIEDIVGRENYIEIVNKAYELDTSRRVPAMKPADAAARVAEEVRRHFMTLPADAPTFDHYGPAEYLVKNAAKLRKLPDYEGALARFEQLFHDLNGLLSN